MAQSVSLFYAEVRRIKMVLEAARSSEPPLFFLLDEILRGTNAGERHTAVRSIVLDLLDAGARGILSTHDTALLDISREETGVGLYHFQEAVQDGKMVFDYKMMPGPPSGSNALAVLRGEGIRIR
ncbi:MAG: hypothetical protein HY042_02260 [Spirochaetia bacterium]|nr:hypothetical protein [Spirochaetia bacterium]